MGTTHVAHFKKLILLTKENNLDYQKTMQTLLSMQLDKEEATKIQKCIQQESLLEESSHPYDEGLSIEKDVCNRKKFQWLDLVWR